MHVTKERGKDGKIQTVAAERDYERDFEEDVVRRLPIRRKRKRFGARHVQIIFVFLCLTISMAMRANFSVAIVAMTGNSTSENPDIPTYSWKNTRIMLSAFFWSYILLQVAAGYVAKTYGAKYPLLVSSAVNTAAFTLIPLSAQWFDSYGVIVMRVVQGLMQGCVFPCAHTLMGRWAPAEERNILGMIVYSGISVGAISSFIITGYVCSSWYGWPLSFYIFGVCGVVWCILYFFFGYNSPASHPRISPEERAFIEHSLGTVQHDQAVPWKKILTCVPFWAVVSANVGSAWLYTMLMTQIPSYLGYVMKFKISSNGVVSSVPYMAAAVFGFIFAGLSDWLIGRMVVTTIQARRIFQLGGAYGMVICLMVLSYEGKTQVLAVTLLSLANCCYASTLVGYSVNFVDLSPTFAGIIQGISNAISQSIAMFCPLMIQYVVTDLSDANQWKLVFMVACGFYFTCATIYGFWSSAARQKWDGPTSSETIASFEGRRPTLSAVHSIPGFEFD